MEPALNLRLIRGLNPEHSRLAAHGLGALDLAIGQLGVLILLYVAEVFAKGPHVRVRLVDIDVFVKSIVDRPLLAGPRALLQLGVLVVGLSLRSLEVGVEA